MNVTNINTPLTPAEFAALTVDGARARLAAMSAAADRGDYGWSYDEYLRLVAMVPEEKAKSDAAWARHTKRAARGRRRLGL